MANNTFTTSSILAEPEPLPLKPQRTLKGALWQILLVTAVMLCSLQGYLLVLKWRGPAAQVITYLPLDDLVPFRPGWVWVYLIPYLIGPFAIGLMQRRTFHWYVGRGLVVVCLSLVIFMLLPTQTAPRPPADLADGPTASLYQNMIAIDEPPANAAPSLHVSLSFLLALALLRDFPRWFCLTIPGVALVWLATLFTRQHHVIDVVTGIFLAFLVVKAWPLSQRQTSGSEAGENDRVTR